MKHKLEKSINNIQSKPLLISYLQLILVSFTWALSTIIIKSSIGSIPAFHLLMGRFGIGALIIFIASPKKLLSVSKKDVKITLALSLIMFAAYALNILGLKYTSASKSGFLASLSVLFIPIIQCFINKKLPSIWIVYSVILSTFGLYMISGMNGDGFNIGDMLCIGSALSYTAYIILLNKVGQNRDEYILSLLQLLFMFIISAVLSFTIEGLNINALKLNFGPIAIIGILGTGLTMLLQIKAQKIASPESVGILLLSEPLFILIMAFLILHEAIMIKGILGCILILISLVTVVLKKV